MSPPITFRERDAANVVVASLEALDVAEDRARSATGAHKEEIDVLAIAQRVRLTEVRRCREAVLRDLVQLGRALAAHGRSSIEQAMLARVHASIAMGVRRPGDEAFLRAIGTAAVDDADEEPRSGDTDIPAARAS